MAVRQHTGISALLFCHLQFQVLGPLPPPYPRELRTIGDHLRRRWLDLNLRQRDVAARLGTNTSTITNWELGHTEPEIRFLLAIIRFLGYSPLAAPVSIAERIRTSRALRGLSRQKMASTFGTGSRHTRPVRARAPATSGTIPGGDRTILAIHISAITPWTTWSSDFAALGLRVLRGPFGRPGS